MFYPIIVLSLAHRDPPIKGCKKLECFSKKSFEVLRRLLKEVILKRDELGITPFVSRERENYRKERYKSRQFKPVFGKDGFITIIKKEETWWDKERWGDSYNLENPWYDLSREDEMRLKKIIKGG